MSIRAKFIEIDIKNLYHFSILSVIDKPSPPQGPLDISDITPETCTLSWKAPFDDGGSPVTNYIVEKLDPAGVSICHFSFSSQERLLTYINDFSTG